MAKTARGEKQSFLDVLQDELRREIRAELLEELTADPAFVAQQKNLRAEGSDSISTAGALSGHEKLFLWLNTRFRSPLDSQDSNQSASPYTRPIPNAYRTRRKNSSTRTTTPAANLLHVTDESHDGPCTQAKPHTAPDNDKTKNQHALDVRDIAALEFFRRNGAALTENFSEPELRTAYRQIALKLHPDRHHQASETERTNLNQSFSQLTELTQHLARHIGP